MSISVALKKPLLLPSPVRGGLAVCDAAVYLVREYPVFATGKDEWKDIGVDDLAALTTFRKAILHKDQGAWHIIWSAFHPVIMRKLRRELTGWIQTDEEVRDLTQAVFIKFWEDTLKWTEIPHLYTQNGREGVVSRLHSTAVFTVQRHRQTLVRKWIPVIRDNVPRCPEADRLLLQDIARDGLSRKYSDVFLLHLRDYPNTTIASLMAMELRDVSIQINRAWERFIYVLLQYRQRNASFHPLFRRLMHQETGDVV